jgi:hypothetical protein
MHWYSLNPLLSLGAEMMRGVELKTLTEFDLAEADRELSQAALEAHAAHEQVTDSAIRCTTTVRDIRRAMRQRPANLELVGALHRLYRHQYRDLDAAKARLQGAQEHEARLRDAVNERLMREKLLACMLRRHTQTRQGIFELQQHKLLEDAWLRASRSDGT